MVGRSKYGCKYEYGKVGFISTSLWIFFTQYKLIQILHLKFFEIATWNLKSYFFGEFEFKIEVEVLCRFHKEMLV